MYNNPLPGTWIANEVLPPQDPEYDRSINTIVDHNEALLLQILNDNETATNYPKIIPFYQNCMDTVAIDALGHSPFDELKTTCIQVLTLSKKKKFWLFFGAPR